MSGCHTGLINSQRWKNEWIKGWKLSQKIRQTDGNIRSKTLLHTEALIDFCRPDLKLAAALKLMAKIIFHKKIPFHQKPSSYPLQ